MLQEIETRFGTMHTVVERFIKSSAKVSQIVESKHFESAMTLLQDLTVFDEPSGKRVYPALKDIVAVFRPLRHIQTALEASNNSTIHMLLPMMETAKTELRNISSGMSQSPNFQVPHAPVQEFCGCTLFEMRKIEVHDLWIDGCLLCPRMRGLSFVLNMQERKQLKYKGCDLIRKMMGKVSKATPASEEMSRHQPVPLDDSRMTPNSLGVKSFRLDDAFDFPDFSGTDTDGLSKYLGTSFARSTMDILSSENGLAEFWLTTEHSWPELTKIALRVLATPVSSCSSEHNFSAVNRIVTADRSRFKSDVLEDLIIVRSCIPQDSIDTA